MKLMRQRGTSRIFDVVFLAIVVALVALAATHRYQLADWWALRGYQPPPGVARLADAAGFNANGRRIFYSSHPQLVERATLDQVCSVENLGCITAKGQIYILAEAGESNQATVTAAHEMLHAAYRRLSRSEKGRLATLEEAEVARGTHVALASEVKPYETDPDARADELHSILGSEYGGLDPALESYYSLYFADRSRVIAANQANQ